MPHRIAAIVHGFARFSARHWRIHEFLVAAGFDERRLRPLKVPDRSPETDDGRIELVTSPS
jgi:hypothetical protein